MELPRIHELLDLEGKVALVTGAAGGIGQAVAYRLAECGASVVICDLQETPVETTAEDLNRALARDAVKAVHVDLALAEGARDAVRATLEVFGRIDILVNNAGVFSFRPVLEITEELWDLTLDVNVKGLFFASQEAARAMADAGRGGAIVNIASIDAFRPTGNLAHYDASKGAVVMLTKALALELGRHDIRVNAVAPGGVKTPGVAKLTGPWPDRSSMNQMPPPIEAMAEPDEIARIVLMLAAETGSNMTGETVVCDGGTLLA